MPLVNVLSPMFRAVGLAFSKKLNLGWIFYNAPVCAVAFSLNGF